MLNQICKHTQCVGKTKAEKRIEEIRAKVEEVMEKLVQIEV